jgi:phosphate transport system substrate-binding protein
MRRNEMRRGSSLALAMSAILMSSMLLGCINEASDSISVVGSTTVQPIATKAAEQYMDDHENADIQVSGGGSSTGIQSVGEGTADIGMASRQIKSSETEQYPGLVEHVVAKDGIAIIVHPSNSVSGLTMAQLKSIYKGEITNWKDVGGPDLEIVVVGRDSASGTREFFHEAVMNKEDFVASQLEKASNAGVKESVKNTEGAIGYVGLGYLDETVKAIKVDDVDATVAKVISGDYPVSRALYMYTEGEPTGLAKAYLDFIKSPAGQTIVEEEGFVPLA